MWVWVDRIALRENSSEEVTRAFLAQSEQVIEVRADANTDTTPKVEDIFVGRIASLKPDTSQVLVEYGSQTAGILTFKKGMHVGQKLLVQITRQEITEAYQHKGAKLTTDITLSGAWVRYKPFGKGIVWPKGINSDLQHLLEQDLSPLLASEGGVIIRSVSRKLSSQESGLVVQEVANLQQHTAFNIQEIGSKMYSSPLSYLRLLLDIPISSGCSIYVKELALYQQVKEFLKDWRPDLSEEVKLVSPHLNTNPEQKSLIEECWEGLQNPFVPLSSGGHLVIEETTALTTIDMNQSTYEGREVAACGQIIYEEIAREVRLRQLGGVIVIDWPLIKDPQQRQVVVKNLEKALKKDPAKPIVLGWTRGGLMEIMRTKRGESLPRQLHKLYQRKEK